MKMFPSLVPRLSPVSIQRTCAWGDTRGGGTRYSLIHVIKLLFFYSIFIITHSWRHHSSYTMYHTQYHIHNLQVFSCTDSVSLALVIHVMNLPLGHHFLGQFDYSKGLINDVQWVASRQPKPDSIWPPCTIYSNNQSQSEMGYIV